MKLWIDDQAHDPNCPDRWAPEGWTPVTTPWAAVRALKTGLVTHVNFDHDLGAGLGQRGGLLVALWIERESFRNPLFRIPVMSVHSQNPVGRGNIERAIESIERAKGRRG